MRYRGTPDWQPVLNEIPLYFSKDAEIMRLWRSLAYSTTTDRSGEQLRLVLAVIRAVGFSTELEQEDINKFMVFPAPGEQTSTAATLPTVPPAETTESGASPS